jgi:hypothetical protein
MTSKTRLNRPGANRLGAALLAGGLMVLGGIAGGCDSSSSESGLVVEPSSATIEGKGSALFSVAGDTNDTSVVFPLNWTVENPALGRIVSQGGNAAVYESFGGDGNNVVTATDQAGRSGIALVTQP